VVTAGAPFATADTALATKYLTVQTGDELSVLQDSAGTASNIATDASSLTAAAHILCVQSSGTAYTLMIDNGAETENVIAGSDNGDWFSDTADRDNVSIGAEVKDSAAKYFNGIISEIYVYDGTVSDAQRTKIFQRLAAHYGITIAS